MGFYYFITDAYFKKTGLEQSEALAKDLEWLGQQGFVIPEPSGPGISYAKYLGELSEKSAPLFMCHFYNIYFSHIAGGQVIARQVCVILYSCPCCFNNLMLYWCFMIWKISFYSNLLSIWKQYNNTNNNNQTLVSGWRPNMYFVDDSSLKLKWSWFHLCVFVWFLSYFHITFITNFKQHSFIEP